MVLSLLNSVPHTCRLARNHSYHKIRYPIDSQDGSQDDSQDDSQDTHVVVCIEDTGPGIPEAIRARIFDAFFTTKTGGEGSGLGLAIMKVIIEKHQGRIELESNEGSGTRFTVSLPYQDS